MNGTIIGRVLHRQPDDDISAVGTKLPLGPILSGAASTRPALADTKLSMWTITQSSAPRWVLPENARRAIVVLKSWKPYSAKSRMKWRAVVGACQLNMLHVLPGARREELLCDLSYWREHLPGYSDSWAITAYIGHPSPSRKALLFFLDTKRQVRAVAKVPIYPAAKSAILNEATVLNRMQHRLPVPVVLFSDEVDGIAAQSWMQGANVARTFKREHLELLMRLASDRAGSPLAERREELELRCAYLSGAVDPSLCHRALSLLDVKEEIRQCVEHGDFTPWNLRQLSDRQLALIDWEWSVEAGYPLQDICRYFYVQDYLFRERANVWRRLITDPLLVEYCRRLDLSGEGVRGLTAYFLLRLLCESHAEGDLGKVAFAAAKIQELLIG